MIIDGKAIAESITENLELRKASLPRPLTLGILMNQGDAATESFIRIKSRVAERLGVEVVREELPAGSTTAQAIEALMRLAAVGDGIIVQLPLSSGIDAAEVVAAIPADKDVDGIGPYTLSVVPPVAGAAAAILDHIGVTIADKKTVVVGAGRLVGKPVAELLRTRGARVVVVTEHEGSLDELHDADIVVLGAGNPGFIKPTMLKPGVVLIDAGTSEAAGGKLVGDADPACADVSSFFTPVPGGIGPVAVAMIFRNLFELAKKHV